MRRVFDLFCHSHFLLLFLDVHGELRLLTSLDSCITSGNQVGCLCWIHDCVFYFFSFVWGGVVVCFSNPWTFYSLTTLFFFFFYLFTKEKLSLWKPQTFYIQFYFLHLYGRLDSFGIILWLLCGGCLLSWGTWAVIIIITLHWFWKNRVRSCGTAPHGVHSYFSVTCSWCKTLDIF